MSDTNEFNFRTQLHLSYEETPAQPLPANFEALQAAPGTWKQEVNPGEALTFPATEDLDDRQVGDSLGTHVVQDRNRGEAARFFGPAMSVIRANSEVYAIVRGGATRVNMFEDVDSTVSGYAARTESIVDPRPLLVHLPADGSLPQPLGRIVPEGGAVQASAMAPGGQPDGAPSPFAVWIKDGSMHVQAAPTATPLEIVTSRFPRSTPHIPMNSQTVPESHPAGNPRGEELPAVRPHNEATMMDQAWPPQIAKLEQSQLIGRADLTPGNHTASLPPEALESITGAVDTLGSSFKELHDARPWEALRAVVRPNNTGDLFAIVENTAAPAESPDARFGVMYISADGRTVRPVGGIKLGQAVSVGHNHPVEGVALSPHLEGTHFVAWMDREGRVNVTNHARNGIEFLAPNLSL